VAISLRRDSLLVQPRFERLQTKNASGRAWNTRRRIDAWLVCPANVDGLFIASAVKHAILLACGIDRP
jgi:hypothetical protein